MTNKPVIMSTLGDAGGIGPELVARSLDKPEITEGAKRVIVGNSRVFDMGREVAGTTLDIKRFTDFDEAVAAPDPVVFHHIDGAEFDKIPYGVSTAAAGEDVYRVGCYGADLARAGKIDAFVWSPINKASMHKAGHHFEGYKAAIADYMGFRGLSTEINTIGHMWTCRVTSHIPISAVAGEMDPKRIEDVLIYFERELRRFGYASPRIAVSGLNPHNGDEGAFGREEIDIIRPLVERVKARGLNVEGPFPPDTIFLTVQEQGFLGVLSMYHDQCQIATKLLGFDDGVTYFGGLPHILATPAHGTAYDIAGQGKARPNASQKAHELACRAARIAKGLPHKKDVTA
ncbi:4-hydroxythreonine-4-phosphate dehydrogenase PdxA [Paracoccus sp. Z330]|uniref:4-hydroxythreonine-4-phosphate dehydrogenase PdxA n=1 Tax=Paracoccus onchidii TaxID=3017813 RepID=A0ABT4ZGH5_9RHOB|nr:4-hydroxythreonine-4-phosphate dehydrogenase PdxA [Paracoccus onchidii]MDB6178430.1 4-hydroxythreonine-4-phosphate dehydrogenase PdxA [Paracoccus onchidii]